MIENKNEEIQILLDILINKKDKNYLIVMASNKSLDYLVILVQHSSFVYTNKYLLKDFKQMNFFKNYIFFGLNQFIEIIQNLLKEKKNEIKIEEKENKYLKLCIDIEISIGNMNLNLPKEKIEIILKNEAIDKNLQNRIILSYINYLIQGKKSTQKTISEQENTVKQLQQDIFELKLNLETREINDINLISYEYKNDLKRSRIIKEHNKDKFEFVKKRAGLFKKNKKITFHLLYSVKKDGDQTLNFHQLCDNHKNTLILIKTNLNVIFGGFARKYWNSLELGRKRDIKSFLFSVDKQRIYNPKPEAKYHLFCSEQDGPCFYAFSVENNCLKNGGFCDEIYKCSYDSFENDYELNNGDKYFKIEELEIFEIIFF